MMPSLKYTLIGLLMAFTLICLIIYGLNSPSCEEAIRMNFSKESGSFVIDTIYLDVGAHAYIMQSKNGDRIKYDEGFLAIQAEVGDSIYKPKGVFEYVLVKKDSTYVQSWSCSHKESFIIDRWKNGEKRYFPSSSDLPDPFYDTSNSKIDTL